MVNQATYVPAYSGGENGTFFKNVKHITSNKSLRFYFAFINY